MLHAVREHALSLPGVTESEPFGPGVFVYKVGGKMFLLLSPSGEVASMNFKVPPEEGAEERAIYPSVTPGWHMNKRHWSTLRFDGRVPASQAAAWVSRSYELVVSGLPRSARPA